MPKFCPICEAEFQENQTTCPKDKVPLSKKIAKPHDDYYVDLYAARDEIEVERIITFLRSEGLDCKETLQGMSQLPFLGDEMHLLSVRKSQAKKAESLINKAREDNVISRQGRFLSEG
jgi:hypothetical protein